MTQPLLGPKKTVRIRCRLGWFFSLLIFGFFLMKSSLLLAANDLGPTQNYFKIDQISMRGLKKVEPEAILERITAQKGKMLTNYMLRNDIEKIYGLKYFEYVEAQQIKKDGKNILLFILKEKPIINKIELVGNDEISDDDLLEKIKSKEFSILDINTIKSDVDTLQKYYEEKGFYLAAIHYELKKVDNENMELVFNIKEQEKVRVKNISFLGNQAFNDMQLKGIMETREESLFSWMSGSGNFKEFNFQTDIERIKYFYKTKGYLQVNVGAPTITVSEDKRWVFISIQVNEGPKFTINEITFNGEILFPEEELLEKIALKPGQDYSEEKLRQDIQMLTEMYQDKGYAFANVLRDLAPIPGENKVDVNFSFEKGKIAYFGKITVKGNTKTRDKVVRRELKIKEGSKFSGSALRESKDNVNRLGFFEPQSVVFNTITPKGKDDVLDVEILVKERNTGQISLGAGYSTATKGFIQASIAQNNFRGLGQNLSFSLSLASNNKTFNLGFTEPYLFDTKWTAGGDIFNTKNEQSNSASEERVGFDVRVGYPIFEYTRLFVTYKYEDTELTNIQDPRIDVTLENGVASSVETSIIQDKRNNRFEPSAGYFTSASVEYAGLGGEKKWLKTQLDGRYYKRIWEDLVLRYRLNLKQLFEIKSEQIPRTEKFFLGGSRNLRGYGYEDIGPIGSVIDPDTGLPILFNERGLYSIYSTLEFEHPLVREAGLKWVVFFDAGNVYNSYVGDEGNYDLRYDYGFGFRWFSPIGVLRFEFGYPLAKKPSEASSQFHFDIGQLF